MADKPLQLAKGKLFPLAGDQKVFLGIGAKLSMGSKVQNRVVGELQRPLQFDLIKIPIHQVMTAGQGSED